MWESNSTCTQIKPTTTQLVKQQRPLLNTKKNMSDDSFLDAKQRFATSTEAIFDLFKIVEAQSLIVAVSSHYVAYSDGTTQRIEQL